MRKAAMFVAMFIAIIINVACSEAHVESIPAGYKARVLTPTGWESDTRSSGQVDLREPDLNGNFSVLVLLEDSSTTVKEQFLAANADPAKQDGTDHRVNTGNGEPLSVDVYIRAMLPDDKTTSDNIFTLVTPKNDEKNDRMKWIKIQDVYERFAALKIRNNIRMIFASYADYKEVAKNYTKINAQITEMVTRTFNEDHVPLKLQDVQLSNVKPDPSVVVAQNNLSSAAAQAEAINQIGSAIRANPEYREYMKWEALKNIAGNQKGTNTVIVTEGSTGNDWARAQYARGENK